MSKVLLDATPQATQALVTVGLPEVLECVMVSTKNYS